MGFTSLSIGLVVSLFAQANLPVPPLPPEGQADIFTAMYDTILHNPSSLFVLIVLCVFAWLMDTIPFINSKFVTHYSTLLGGAIYWMFCHPANVPKSFPYAWPVLACIGFVCGFVAGILHKQIIGRAIEWARNKIPGSEPKPESKSSTTPPLGLFLICGLLAFSTTGCGLFQAKPAKVATNISDASKITVEAALRAWNDYIPVGKPSLEKQEQVREAWKKYKSAQLLLLDCAILVKQSEAAGLNDPQAQEALNISIAEASQALADLIQLLRTFNVKI